MVAATSRSPLTDGTRLLCCAGRSVYFVGRPDYADPECQAAR